MQSISVTEKLIIPCIRDLNNDPGKGLRAFVNREILSRVIVLAMPLFRIMDSTTHLLITAILKGGHVLRGCGVRVISVKSVSQERILRHWNVFQESVRKIPQVMHLLLNPNLAGNTVSKTVKKSLPRIFHQALACEELNKLNEEQLDKDWNLNQYFGHIYVINLKDKPGSEPKNGKKLEAVAADLNKIGCQIFERLEATWGADLPKEVWQRVEDNSWNLPEGERLDKQHMGQAGCFMSHYRVIKDANDKFELAKKELEEVQGRLQVAKSLDEQNSIIKLIQEKEKRVREYSSILILEDDNGFGFVEKQGKGIPAKVSLKGAGVEFRQVMKELKEEWDMLYLVAVDSLRWMKKIFPTYSSHLNRLNGGLLTNAVAINSKAYPVILEALGKINSAQSYRPVDHAYAALHGCLVAVTPKKPLTYQMPGKSSITGGSSNEPWNGTWDPDRGF